MDKLIPLFNFLKRNRFWLTSGLLAAAMIGVWFFASNQLTTAMNSAKSDIERKISSADGIIKTTSTDVDSSVLAHPNDSTIKGMEQEINNGVDSVLAAWEARYEAQAPLLKWPDEVIENADFERVFKRFDPPETFPVDENGSGLQTLLQVYRMQIPKRMNAICDIIGTEWEEGKNEDAAKPAADEAREGKRGPPSGMGPPREGDRPPSGRGISTTTTTDGQNNSIVVQWDKQNQELWNMKLTNFRGFDDNTLPIDIPSPLQVYMLQQDLWLLEAMFNIVKTVNGDADANDLAKIKRIDHVVFGREARAQLGELKKPVTIAGVKTEKSGRGTGMQGDKRGASQRARQKRRGAKLGDDPFADNVDQYKSPFHGRYVDANYDPIPAEDVRQVLKGTELPDKYLELIVARRVPVRIAVRMDERYIPEFLAASAKSPFAFEVYQVRINKHIPGDGIVRVGGATLGAGSGSSDAQQDRGSSIGAGGGGSGAGLSDDGPLPGSSTKVDEDGPIETRTNFDVNVEFYGIVKLYNPVRRSLLTGEEPANDQKPAGGKTAAGSSKP